MIEKSKNYLHKLCVEIPSRRVGSAGNHMATDFFARTVSSYGFRVESQELEYVDRSQQGTQLTVDHTSFEVFVSLYSLGCQARAPLAVPSTIDELKGLLNWGLAGAKRLQDPNLTCSML